MLNLKIYLVGNVPDASAVNGLCSTYRTDSLWEHIAHKLLSLIFEDIGAKEVTIIIITYVGVVLAGPVSGNDGLTYKAVAVVKRSNSKVQSIDQLAGTKACFPGKYIHTTSLLPSSNTDS